MQKNAAKNANSQSPSELAAGAVGAVVPETPNPPSMTSRALNSRSPIALISQSRLARCTRSVFTSITAILFTRHRRIGKVRMMRTARSPTIPPAGIFISPGLITRTSTERSLSSRRPAAMSIWQGRKGRPRRRPSWKFPIEFHPGLSAGGDPFTFLTIRSLPFDLPTGRPMRLSPNPG